MPVQGRARAQFSLRGGRENLIFSAGERGRLNGPELAASIRHPFTSLYRCERRAVHC